MSPKDQLAIYCRSLGFVPEHRFHPVRKWRFDWAHLELKIACEYSGHGSTGKTGHIGRHASVTGMTGDCEKLNSAAMEGWRVLTFTALFFCPKQRAKHKLTDPHDLLLTLTRPNQEI